MSSLAAGQLAIAAWLRNTNSASPSQFTTISVGGIDVGESAQANDLLSYLAGTVRVVRDVDGGDPEQVTVNPDKQQLSFKRTDSIHSWAALVELAFFWIANAVPSNRGLVAGTADHVYSLDDVGYPYDVLIRVPLAEEGGTFDQVVDDDVFDLGVAFEVETGQDPSCFLSNVWMGGQYVGRAEMRIGLQDDRWEHRFRFVEAARPAEAQMIHSAVDAYGPEIHFATQHLYSTGYVSHRPGRPAHFRGFQWEDFSDFDIDQEKPHEKPTQMRAMVGTSADRSLFGWVVNRFNKGWLVCDDGANEVADFVYLTDEELIFIPVKAAKAHGLATSAGSIQLVQAQATKNLIFFDSEGLAGLHRTLKARSHNLVTFLDGVRQPNADGFLDYLAALQLSERSPGVTVVQPQLERSQIEAARGHVDRGRRQVNDLGLLRINAMLRSLDRRGADLGVKIKVIGRLDPDQGID
jgi:hypothetical protein